MTTDVGEPSEPAGQTGGEKPGSTGPAQTMGSTGAASGPPPGRGPRSRARANRGRLIESIVLPLAWVLVIVGFGIDSPHTFLTWGNFSSIFGINTPLFVLAMALLVPLTNGDLDLSVAENAGLVSMLIAWLNYDHHIALVPCLVIGIVAGTLMGVLNGSIIVRYDVNPFIITLATGTVFDGIAAWLSNEQTVSVSPSLGNWTFGKHFLNIPIEFYFGLVVMLIMWYVLTFTPFGQRSLFVGQSREVARLSGFRVRSIRFWGFVIAGFVAGIAGVLNLGTQGSATSGASSNLLLSAYAAAFLGLTTIQPGRFNAIGAGVSVFFLATGVAGLELLGAQNYVQELFYGVVLVIAVVFSRVVNRKRAAAAAASG
jgi:ribose transport system permease protein